MKIHYALFIGSISFLCSLEGAHDASRRNPTLPEMFNTARGALGQGLGFAQQAGGAVFSQFMQGMMPSPGAVPMPPTGAAGDSEDAQAAGVPGDTAAPATPAKTPPKPLFPEDQAMLDQVRAQVEQMKAGGMQAMSDEQKAALTQQLKNIRAEHAAGVDRAEYKPLLRIPLRFGIGRGTVENTFNAADGLFERVGQDPRFRGQAPQMPENFRPDGAGREAVANTVEGFTDLFIPRHLSISKNDLLRASTFGVELWALRKMYDSYAEKRIAFVTKQLLKNSSDTLEAIAGFDPDATPSEKKKAAGLLSTHRFITRNPFSLRRVGIFALIHQWVLYKSLGYFKKMLPVSGTFRQRMQKIMMSKLPREVVGDRPEWEKNIAVGDMPLSSLIYYLRMGMLGKDVFLADVREKTSRVSGLGSQMLAAYYGLKGFELPAWFRTPHGKKALWLLEQFMLAYLTFIQLDEQIHTNWHTYFMREKEDIEVLLHQYESMRGRPNEREKAADLIRDFVVKGHLAHHGSGPVMTVVKSFNISGAKKFDEETVSKAALFIKSRLKAQTGIRMLKNLRYLLPIYWHFIKKGRRLIGV